MQMLKDLEVCILISVCVHCLLAQTFPYVSFNGQTLANHSYVNLSLVGNDTSGSDSVQCHTDLSTCCSMKQGLRRGDWYFPNGTRLLFSTDSPKPAVGESRGDQRVDLRRRTQGRSGIYRCNIPTAEVHDDTDASVRDTVYVGLYLNGGEQWYNYSNTNPPPHFVV